MPDYQKFIDKCVILFAIVAMTLLSINFFYENVVLKNKDVYRQHEQFLDFREHNDLKILIFGDSLATDDFNPIYIPGSYNLATPGETLKQSYYKIKWALENEPDVDTYVIQYNRHSFNYYRINPYYDLSYWRFYMSYEELTEETNLSEANLIFTSFLFPVIGKGKEIYRYYFDKRPYVRIDNSWQNYSETFEELQGENMTSNGRTRSLSQFKKYPIVQEADLTEIFIKTLTMLKENNKTVVLVVYPLTDEYLRPLEEKVNITEEFKPLDEKILKQFDNTIILDYRETFRYNQSLFVHSDHLNNKGAEIFTKMLNRDIISNGIFPTVGA